MNQYTTVDEYIAAAPEQTRDNLQLIRKTVKELVPEAQEKIGYGIPTFTYHGNLVHFAGYDHHIGFYPGASPIAELADLLKPYHTSKGTVQFPLEKPLPLELIEQMILLAKARNESKKKV